MLTFQNVSKSYAKGKVKALDGVSFHVGKGKVFGFIGPNGAGKTTAIRLLTGSLQPDEGEILIDGVSMRDNPLTAKRKIGYVPDDFQMYERMTGDDYLRFMGDMYDVPTDVRKERIARYAARFELADALPQQIRSYSRGMKQKLTIIGALMHDPPLWVLDEPMTGLDPKASHLLKEEMRAHCDAGNTVFFSTHVLDVAERLCDEIGIIQRGKLLRVGEMSEILGTRGDETLEDFFLQLTEHAAEEENA